MVTSEPTVEDAWLALEEVVDPEIPVVTIGDLGILRDVSVLGGRVTVDITPTYSGCPAMEAIRSDIDRALTDAGFAEVTVRTVLDEAWTTDWISERGRRRLHEYGIAPPSPTSSPQPVRCPRCAAAGVLVVSEFGSTACKSLMVCQACREPFDHFKVL
jgi:ring-1,2-phenylacetyl-CoA epoxidase subunit PaaD